LGFCETREIILAPKESFSTKINPYSILDLPLFLESFSWKVFNLNLSDKDYNELLISFYSKEGNDPEMVWRRNYISNVKIVAVPEKFQGMIKNYLFTLTRGSQNVLHTVTLADLPLMNPFDIFSILGIRRTIHTPALLSTMV